jgi:hypothetical protein
MTTTPTPLQSFVNLSALLTGIAATSLAPSIDPKNIKQAYFDFASQQAGATFDQLLSIYDANSTKPPAEIADIIFNRSGADICYLARSVMLMWYLGSWYSPEALQQAGTGTPPPDSVVISAAAYTQGWAWSVAQAHPMGFSNFQFGYWANNPPTLGDFVGGNA